MSRKKSDSSGCAGLIFIFLLVVALAYAGYHFFRGTVNVSGQAYVTTKGGNAVKMAGVTVHAIDETALRNFIATLKSKVSTEEWTNTPTSDVVRVVTKSFPFLEHTTETDADGNYAFHDLPPRPYRVLASGNRQIGDTTEWYLWTTRLENSNKGGSYTFNLNNNSDAVSRTTSIVAAYAAQDLISSKSEFEMAFFSLINEYGW